MSKKRRAKIPPFRVLNSENIFRKFVSKIMRSCDKNFAQLQYTLTGTGVGLYHIKDIVEKDLQGTVTIESEPQKGFALHVRFGKV